LAAKLPYQLQIVNGLAGDPAAHVLVRQTGEALLFDLGDLSALSHKDLLKVKHVFISHTHVDHFIGFDRLLRVNIPHRRCLYFYGPIGLAENIRHKILGYTWNLIDDDQLCFEVCEIDALSHTLVRSSLSKSSGFELIELARESCQDNFELVTLSDCSQVIAVPLYHKSIFSISYQLIYPIHSRINSQKMEQLGFKPGPWIKELQSKIARHDLAGVLQIDGQSLLVRSLAEELVKKEESHRFTYLTDISYDRRNLQRLKKAFSQTSCLLSECSFTDADYLRAVDKAHLTSRQAALIGAYLGADSLLLFHVSNIYSQRVEEVVAEAQEFFQSFQKLSAESLESEICREMTRCQL